MSGENLNSAATLSLEIDTGDAAGRLNDLITKYEALQAAFAKEAKAGGVINLSDQVKRLHEELEQTKRALATSLKDFEVLQAKSANGAIAMDKLSASLNRVKGAAEVSGGSIEAATKNVKTLAEEVDRMSKTGVRFDSLAKNFKMLTLESDTSEKGVRKFLATLEQVQYELQQSSGAKQHVIEKWGNDAIAALPKIEALRVKVAEFDAAAAKKTEDGRVAKLVQQLQAEEEAERASYDRRLKVALRASAARRAAEESYVGSWAGLLAERDAVEAKALANSVRRLTEQEAAEAASNKKRLADATSTIASRRAAEESYTKWWIGELASRQAAEAAATLRNVTQRSNMQRLNAERLDRSLGLGGGANSQSAFYESLGAVKGGGSTLASLESSAASDFAAAEAAKRLAAETGNLTEKKAKLTPVINSAHEAQKKWNATSSETHALARGLSGSLGQLWMTYGQIAPLMAGAALGASFKSAMQKGAEFEYQLTFVKAIGGESADAVRDLSKAALDLGSSSMKGPVELAGGLRILAQAGLTAQEAIMALSSATDLAIVGEMGMEDASVTLVGVMNAFSLSVSDISRIGDVFAKAAALSQTSVSGMTNAMRTASVVGEQYGVSMEDAATAITLLAKVNIQGTAAGTSLRNMLKELYTPTDKAAKVVKQLGLSATDSSGNLRSMADVMYDLKGKLASFDKASQVNILQQLFGERGAKEAIAMLSLTRQEWDKLRSSIADSSGFMGQVAAELEMTTKGIFTQSKNLLEVGLIQAFQKTDGAAHELAVSLRDLFASAIFKNSIAGLVEAMSGLAVVLVKIAPLVLAVGVAWASWKGLAALSGGLVALSGTIATVARSAVFLVSTFGSASVATGALQMAMAALGWPLLALTAAIAALYYGYKKWNDLTPESVKSAKTLTDALDRQTEKLKEQNRELEKQLHLKKTGEDMDANLAKKQIKVLEKDLADSAKKLETAGPVETLELYEQQKRIRDQLAELRISAAAAETESRNHDINELRVYVKDKLELIRQFERDAAKAKQEGKLKDVPDTRGLRGSLTALEFVGNTMDKSDRKRDIEKGISDLQMSLFGTGNQKFSASVSKELKAAEKEYAKFSEKVSGYLTKLQAEAENGGKLTEGQRLLAEATGKYAGQIDKVTEAALKEIDTLEEEIRVSKLLAESDSRRYEALEELDKRNLTVTDETAKIREQTAVLMGNTAATLGNTEAKIDAEIASQQRLLRILTENDIESENTRKLRENIRDLEDQKAALNQLAAAKPIAKQREQWKKFSDDIERSLTDALMRGFESGESFGDNFVKSLRNMLKTAALKVVVQAIVDPVMGGVSSMMGLGESGEGKDSGGGMNLFSMADPSKWSGMSPFEAWDTLGDSYETFSNLTESGMGMFDSAKIALDGTGKAFGSLASYASAVFDVANGSYGKGIGSAIGTMFGGPVGGMIGSFIGDKVLGDDLGGLVQEAGGPQQGQYGTLDAKGYKSSYTMSGGDTLQNESLAKLAFGQAATLLQMAGKSASGLTLGQGYKLDPEGTAAGLAYRNLYLDGKTVTGGTFDGNNGAQWVGGNSDAAGAAAYLSKLTTAEIKALVDAIDDAGLSETIDKLAANFTDLGEGIAKYLVAQTAQQQLLGMMMTEEEAATLKLEAANKLLASAFAGLGYAVPANTEAMRSLIEGLDLTTEAGQGTLRVLAGVSEAFLTVTTAAKEVEKTRLGWQQQLDVLQGKYTEQQLSRFFKLIGTQDEATRSLMQQVWAMEDQAVTAKEAADALEIASESARVARETTLEGIESAVGGLSSAYQSEIDQKERLIEKLRGYVTQLREFSQSLALGNLSTLDPGSKYSAAKSEFDDVSRKAALGDQDAMDRLQSVSQAYLQASREYNASSMQYAADYNAVQTALTRATRVAERQASIAEQAKAEALTQLSALGQINNSTLSVVSAINTLQLAMIEALRAGAISSVSESAKTAAGVITGRAGEKYDAKTDTWSNAKGDSASTEALRQWGADILSTQGELALYHATKNIGLSMPSINAIAGWSAGTAERWAKENGLPSFAVGTDYVPRTGIALIHQGEKITPANENRQVEDAAARAIVDGNAIASRGFSLLADKLDRVEKRLAGLENDARLRSAA